MRFVTSTLQVGSIMPVNLVTFLLRPPCGGWEPRLYQPINLVSLMQSHHKPMVIYGGGSPQVASRGKVCLICSRGYVRELARGQGICLWWPVVNFFLVSPSANEKKFWSPLSLGSYHFLPGGYSPDPFNFCQSMLSSQSLYNVILFSTLYFSPTPLTFALT